MLISEVVEIKSQRNVLENIKCFLLHIETLSRGEKSEHLLLDCRKHNTAGNTTLKEQSVPEPQWKSKSHGNEVAEERIKSGSNSLGLLTRC